MHTEHSDQGLRCLPFRLSLLDALFYRKATLFKFYGDYSKFFRFLPYIHNVNYGDLQKQHQDPGHSKMCKMR